MIIILLIIIKSHEILYIIILIQMIIKNFINKSILYLFDQKKLCIFYFFYKIREEVKTLIVLSGRSLVLEK